METTVYFADKSVLFTADAPAGFPDEAVVRDLAEVTRAKILKILETRNSVCVATPQPEAAFARFATGFAQVEAAGGIVVDRAGRWLMIYRNGRWDLPKGHVEEGESCEICAVREIAEETGVCAEVVRPLCATWHAYWFPKTARWELKRTRWYELRAEKCDGLTPQIEEGIERVEWISAEERPALLESAFPTIREVARSMFIRG